MRHFFILLVFVITAHRGLTQSISGDKESRHLRILANNGIEINTASESLAIFNYGLTLEKTDSLEKAFIAYRLVFYFDSTVLIASKARAKLDSIASLYPQRLQTRLLGNWRWIGSGSNWGASDEPKKCKCERSVVFDTMKVYFLERNQVIHTYEYYLKPAWNSRWTTYYIIDVPGLKEKWVAWFGPQWWPVASKYSMTINRMYNCACGCPEEYYERIDFY